MKSYVTIFLSVLLILLIVSSTTYAQIPDLIQESFLYPDGTYLDAQGDSSGGWGGTMGAEYRGRRGDYLHWGNRSFG